MENIISSTALLDSFNDYNLYGYKKTEKDETNKLYRSVIVDQPKNKMVCFSPPKSSPYFATNTDISKGYHIEEFVEGTMINVFFCQHMNYWIPSTRRRIGAQTKFFNHCQSSFLEMFYDAVQELNISFEYVPLNLSFTFVLQHPDNKIVTAFKHPKVYLIDVFEFIDNEFLPKQWSHPLNTTGFQGFENVSFPKSYAFNTSKILETYVKRQPYTFMGLIIRDQDASKRMKYKNPRFEKIQSLRGNQSDILFRYVEVKTERQIRKFLKFFPEFEATFNEFKNHYTSIVETLNQNQHHSYLLKFYQQNTIKAIKKYYNKKNVNRSEIYYYITLLDNKIQYKLLNEMRQMLSQMLTTQTPSLSHAEHQSSW